MRTENILSLQLLAGIVQLVMADPQWNGRTEGGGLYEYFG